MLRTYPNSFIQLFCPRLIRVRFCKWDKVNVLHIYTFIRRHLLYFQLTNDSRWSPSFDALQSHLYDLMMQQTGLWSIIHMWFHPELTWILDSKFTHVSSLKVIWLFGTYSCSSWLWLDFFIVCCRLSLISARVFWLSSAIRSNCCLASVSSV